MRSSAGPPKRSAGNLLPAPSRLAPHLSLARRSKACDESGGDRPPATPTRSRSPIPARFPSTLTRVVEPAADSPARPVLDRRPNRFALRSSWNSEPRVFRRFGLSISDHCPSKLRRRLGPRSSRPGPPKGKPRPASNPSPFLRGLTSSRASRDWLRSRKPSTAASPRPTRKEIKAMPVRARQTSPDIKKTMKRITGGRMRIAITAAKANPIATATGLVREGWRMRSSYPVPA
jgi:hypothetical protein